MDCSRIQLRFPKRNIFEIGKLIKSLRLFSGTRTCRSMPSASKPRARLTEDQVVQIFKYKLDSPQLSSSALATHYCVGEKTVRDIWTGRTWSRQTWHLDTSRTLQLKQPGRPKGSKDAQPRKKRLKRARAMPDDVSQSSISTRGSDELSGPVSVRTWLSEDAIDQREHAVYTNPWLKMR